MIKEARGFGLTIDEAKEKAISDLNMPEEADIQFEVISTPKKKTLGLFGGRMAEVRVFVELPDEKPAKSKKNRPQKEEKQPVSQNKPQIKSEPKAKEAKSETKETKPAKKSVPEYGEPVSADTVSADSKAGRAIAYLKSILESLGCNDTEIKIAEKDNSALIELNGEGLGVVIGHRGETLDSLQYLTGLAASNGGGYYKVTLDIGNYREKREEALAGLAKRISEQVLKTGKCRSLEPMNPYERRIIHTTVQSIDGVISGSFGEGSARHVVIGIEGKELRPLRRDPRRRNGYSHRTPQAKQSPVNDPSREPKRDSDAPLYGKIN